ncbi:MAG: type II toxin-antitoxin system VapC family toxin [Acidimicrobiaceae bacterium]|nr:type II toxin-antitoxin system VapC family toxin [Acidimicrobiaceae bacterium]
MIVYLDSSVLARIYLRDEPGHDEAVKLINNPEIGFITGGWTRIEVSGALVRAARIGRGNEKDLLTLLDMDLAVDGLVTLVAADQEQVERSALNLVREHTIRAMDAWHLAVASLTFPSLVEPGEETGFATRDEAQSEVARLLGMLTF